MGATKSQGRRSAGAAGVARDAPDAERPWWEAPLTAAGDHRPGVPLVPKRQQDLARQVAAVREATRARGCR